MNTPYKNLSSPMQVGNILFRNRIFTAPTGVHALQNGELYYTEAVIRHMANRAKSGAAMVTCSGVQINPEMKSDGNHLHINPYTVEGKRSMIKLADRIHFHGAVASMELGDQYLYDQYYAVTAGLLKMGRTSVEMPLKIMELKAKLYADAALKCKECGFDMIMLHIGHGGEVGQFISPMTNKRNDEFGGSLENRVRFPMMIIDAIRAAVGKSFLIEMRFSVSEVDPDGITVPQSIEFAKILEGKVDLLHCSCGLNTARYFTTTHPSGFLEDTPNVKYAAAIKASGVKIPVVAIGAIQELSQAEEIIASGKADFVSIARGNIAESNLANIAIEGRGEDVRPCVKCFKCHDGSCYYDHYVCSVNPVIGIEDKLEAMIEPVKSIKNVAVVGGGPAGMQAAIYLSERGHSVTLYEKNETLGGQLNFADYANFKRDLKRFKEYLIRQLAKTDVKVMTSTEANAATLAGFDHIIAAVGASPLVIPIKGVENATLAPAAFGNENKLGKRVVIIGGGQVGVETGLHLTDCGKAVTILEMQSKIAPDAWFTYKWAMDLELNERENINCIVNGRCSEIKADGVAYLDTEGNEQIIPADSVVLAVGMKPNTGAAKALMLDGVRFTAIGDCKAVGTVQQAIASAFAVAMNM